MEIKKKLEFIEYIVSEQCQAKLPGLGLFSVLTNISGLYPDNPEMDALERALGGSVMVCHAFTDAIKIDEMNRLSIAYLLGEEGTKDKIREIRELYG